MGTISSEVASRVQKHANARDVKPHEGNVPLVCSSNAAKARQSTTSFRLILHERYQCAVAISDVGFRRTWDTEIFCTKQSGTCSYMV